MLQPITFEYGDLVAQKIIRWDEVTLTEIITYALLVELSTYNVTGKLLDTKLVRIGNDEFDTELEAKAYGVCYLQKYKM